MAILTRFEEAKQLSIEELLKEDTCGKHVQPGDLVHHTDNQAFEGVVVSVQDGRAKVRVRRWHGVIPPQPVSVPVMCLVVLD